MADLPVKLSSLIQDFDRSFWEGDGSLSITFKDLVETFETSPEITLAKALQGASPPFLRSGVQLEIDNRTLGLGTHGGISMSVDFQAAFGNAMDIVLGQTGLDALPAVGSLDLKTVLGESVVNLGEGGLIILSLAGSVQGGVSGSGAFSPGINVGFTFKAGGGIQWFYCRPVSSDSVLLTAIGETFSRARLPQAGLKVVGEAGIPIAPAENEVIYTCYSGFLSLGAQATFGYEFSGTKDYSLGKLDLSTKLLVQASARLSFDYQLAGSFQLTVTQGDSPEWVRVAVEKDRSSSFEFGLGIAVNVSAETPGTGAGGLELVEGIIGSDASQVLTTALNYAQMTPQDLRKQIDGFTQATIEKWVGKGIDEIPDDVLQGTLDQLAKIQSALSDPAQFPIDLYSRFLDTVDYEDAIGRIREIFGAADLDTARNLLFEKIDSPQLRQLLEGLSSERFASIATADEELFASVKDALQERLDQFDQLVTGTAKDEIREFVNAKLEALQLDKIAAEVAKYDTEAELKANLSAAGQEFVSRLIDRPFNEVFADGSQASEVFKEVNQFAASFKKTVTKVGVLIEKALNSKGRFELSYSYQTVRENEKLVDLQIKVGTSSSPIQKGMDLYDRAVQGQFREVLQDQNLDVLKIGKATFTESLRKTATLSVHIFGWNFKETSSILSDLESSVKVGGTGLITVYNLKIEGKRVTEEDQRTTELSLMLQLVGSAKGALLDDDFKKRSVDGLKELSSLQSNYQYEIKDELTTPEELQSYFEVGRNLGVIDAGQQARLMSTVRTVGGQGLDVANYGKADIRYTSSFKGEALAKALATDYSGLVEDLAPGEKLDNAGALERLFVDRLLASYYVGKDDLGNAVPALYGARIFEAFKKNPNLSASQWTSKTFTVASGGKSVQVDPRETDVEWARVLYFRNVWLAKFLEDFRQALVGEKQLTFESLQGQLEEFVEKLKNVGKRDAHLAAMPFLLLDTMIRRSSPGEKDVVEALLEVILYDKTDPTKELLYIPIQG